MAVARLGPALREAERAGLLTAWFFLRKAEWRVRYLPIHASTAANTRDWLENLLETMRHQGHIEGWVHTMYEPETDAFGGAAAMAAAHTLFHADSRYILEHLARPDSGARDRRRELSLLLLGAQHRAAGLDWYETGDVWSRISTTMRPVTDRPDRTTLQNLTAQVRRLVTAQPCPEDRAPDDPLHHAAPWIAAFATAGRTLGHLARGGTLTRGLRAVLAHHVIFHWNRIGIGLRQQEILALTAREVFFGD